MWGFSVARARIRRDCLPLGALSRAASLVAVSILFSRRAVLVSI
jgi:hypothetical protein